VKLNTWGSTLDSENGRIIENARSGQPFRAAVADTNRTALGPPSTHQVLGLYVEDHGSELDGQRERRLTDANGARSALQTERRRDVQGRHPGDRPPDPRGLRPLARAPGAR
jgi:hypothetical protein